jgi:hypothetical protein
VSHPQGGVDGLGDRIIGSFAACAGGQPPSGTVSCAEENLPSQVVEAMYADGSSSPPSERPFRVDGERLESLGNPYGLVSNNKYGWMVEIDPRWPGRPLLKHTAPGRFHHEAAAVRARTGQLPASGTGSVRGGTGCLWTGTRINFSRLPLLLLANTYAGGLADRQKIKKSCERMNLTPLGRAGSDG